MSRFVENWRVAPGESLFTRAGSLSRRRRNLTTHSWARVRGKVQIGDGPMQLAVTAIPEPDDPYAEY